MITGVVLARNEASNIVDCVSAFSRLVDELILIDMQSNDSTVELARPYVNTVLTHPIISNFDAARNLAIPIARFDWLWFCDADERPSEFVGQTIRNLVATRGHEFEAISIPFKTYFCGKWIEHCGWWPGYTMPRVLKKGCFRFREQLHGGVEVQGREVRIQPDPQLGIDHYSYESVSHYFEKFNRYTSTESENLLKQGAVWDWRAATHAMVRDLWQYYERNDGHLDNAHGWVLSWLSGQYRWASYAKLLNSDNPASISHPEDLDEFFAEAQSELRRLRLGQNVSKFGVRWRTPIDDPSGYAEEGRCLTKALAMLPYRLALQKIAWSDQSITLLPQDDALIRALASVTPSDCSIAITNCIPSLVSPTPGAVVNVLRTTFETDRLPPSWIPRINAFDEAWVFSRFNYETFVRSGIAPEKLRIVPSCVDVSQYSPNGPTRQLPHHCLGRFVFLSVMDWQLRKGWDVLLKAYVREFALHDNTALLLKVSRQHGVSIAEICEQAQRVLSEAKTSLEHRPDIVIDDSVLMAQEMANLYRSVDAFVLATRGEGWGRPLMEAMSSGLVVIGTAGSGNADFMTVNNSLLVDSALTPVSAQAAAEIPTFAGHHWLEPIEASLRAQLRTAFSDKELRRTLGRRASEHIRANFGLECAAANLNASIKDAMHRFVVQPINEVALETGIRVELQGEFLSGHSFSNVNEYLVRELGAMDGISLSVKPRFEITDDQLKRDARAGTLRQFVNRDFKQPAQVIIRHAYPPDWSDVGNAKWVHIQPWEFGYLPVSWLEPLRERVDEAWVPSVYVKRVFERSGIPGHKVHVIPWGVDRARFNLDAIPRLIPNSKAFRFLYVGGTVPRKGFDLLLTAYIEEFSCDDDVCLVIKDAALRTAYRYGNMRERILAEAANPANPQIVYYDEEMTPGQLSSLYRSCHCLVAPYRGEGFGLPILEAMACGVPPIVPVGGPSDDFVDSTCGFPVEAKVIETSHPEVLCGPPSELHVSIQTLRSAMRSAISFQQRTAELGLAAALRVKESYGWEQTASAMVSRIQAISANRPHLRGVGGERLRLTVLVDGHCDAVELASLLGRTTPFVTQVIVGVEDLQSSQAIVAQEYRARVVITMGTDRDARRGLLERECAEDRFVWFDQSTVVNDRTWTTVSHDLAQCPGEGGEFRIQRSRARNEFDTMSPAMRTFMDKYHPFLKQRASTFLEMMRYLDGRSLSSPLIVETGCVRMRDDWGAGQSTLIFDSFVEHASGRFVSIDCNEQHCQLARSLCRSSRTTVVQQNSLVHLQHLSDTSPGTIDVLYLDSLDVDWENPHGSALHHLQELCAARLALKPGALVVIDDHVNESGKPGKSKYVSDFLRSINARCVFEAYQIGWIL